MVCPLSLGIALDSSVNKLLRSLSKAPPRSPSKGGHRLPRYHGYVAIPSRRAGLEGSEACSGPSDAVGCLNRAVNVRGTGLHFSGLPDLVMHHQGPVTCFLEVAAFHCKLCQSASSSGCQEGFNLGSPIIEFGAGTSWPPANLDTHEIVLDLIRQFLGNRDGTRDEKET